ncbi:BRO family protein [Massilia sp. NP310]|uniref:BRO-N domain-containing protein n=1 Tax=Massilia sp. NP310 TaxID=2861282 RepID=UPI001C62B981|nr:BRO family protein [Massilia sp. NP310]QYG01883.1 phage antirepressor [Massilia sp. NP310]
MSGLIPFKFEKFDIRVSVESGEPFFNVGDLCMALGFGNSRQAVDTHVDPDDVQKMDAIDSMGRTQQANHVNESGMYALILGATKAEAKRFKKWVTSEVLPTIRKTGSFSAAPPSRLDSAVQALKLAPLAVRAARAFGLDKNVAAISANQYVCSVTGHNLLKEFGNTHLLAENQETQWFTPTQLKGESKVSAQKLNEALAAAGLQERRDKVWELTPAGHAYARLFDTGKKHNSGTMVQQIRWSPKVLAELRHTGTLL